MPIRLVLADDEPLVRAGLAMLLSAEPDIDVVGEAGDGDAAVDLAARHVPDVVLMDVRMPGTDGVAATRRITGRPDSLIRVLMLTTYHVDDAVHAALRAGASGFLLKHAAPVELTQAVRAVAAGNAWLDPVVTRRLLADLVARPTPERRPELDRLTVRERDVLLLVAEGLSNMEIAGRLLIGEATVKTHLGRVLMKLGLRDRAQAVAAAYRGGLVR